MTAVIDWTDKLHPKLLPKSPLRRATTDAVNQRPFFRRCFDDGRFEIDNGRVERRIRLFATGRKAWLFFGSDDHAQAAANLYSLRGNLIPATQHARYAASSPAHNPPSLPSVLG